MKIKDCIMQTVENIIDWAVSAWQNTASWVGRNPKASMAIVVAVLIIGLVLKFKR